MAVNAIDNSVMKNYRDVGITGFEPSVEYVYDAEAKEVDFTDATVYGAGRALKKVHVRVHDKFGKEVRGVIAAPEESGAEASATVSVATLNSSKPFDITCTIICEDGVTVADGGAYNIGAAGTVDNWDAQKNAVQPS